MDTRMLGAGVVAALGMTLLIPTFNALNNSYVEDVQPPPWMPTPDEIPPIEPPEDFEPPEGEPPEDFEVPPGYEGPVPPVCPPPVVRPVNETLMRGPVTPAFQPVRVTFDVPKYAIALIGFVNVTGWQAARVATQLDTPGGNDWAQEQTAGGGALLVDPQPKDSRWEYNSYREESQQPPKEGSYTFTLQIDLPVDGDFETGFGVVLPCGGLLSE